MDIYIDIKKENVDLANNIALIQESLEEILEENKEFRLKIAEDIMIINHLNEEIDKIRQSHRILNQ